MAATSLFTMADDALKTTHACRCLNVKMQLQPPMKQPPFKPLCDPDFSLAMVVGGGIVVAHTQLTLRTHSKRVPLLEDPSQCTRYTTLSCLICQIYVYRVRQVIPIDAEGKEGPLWPTDDWVERDTPRSNDGWLEVHKSCLTGEALVQAAESGSYSDTFSLLLPSPLNTDSKHESEPNIDRTHEATSTYASGPFFSDVRPLFLPAPFTPSHPVFVYLSTLAVNKSDARRAAAEAQIVQVVKDKTAQIELVDDSLRREVEILWTRFKASIDEQHKIESSTGRRGSDARCGTTTGPDSKHGPVSVRNFVPTRVATARMVSTTSATHKSSLSASLATSGMHHPNESQEHPPVPLSTVSAIYKGDGSSILSNSPRGLSSSSESSPPISEHVHLGVGSSHLDQPFRRDMDQTKDTIASYRWFTIQAEMEKARHHSALNTSSYQGGTTKATTSTNGVEKANEDMPALGKSAVGGPTNRAEAKTETSTESTQQGDAKGKRKVSFDVQPNAVTMQRELDAKKKEEDEKTELDAAAMIFDMDDQRNDQSSSNAVQPVLMFVEPVRSPVRRPHRRQPKPSGGQSLPATLSGLRPASLPLPSHVPRPPSPPPQADPQPPLQGQPRAPSPPNEQIPVAPSPEMDEPDAQLLKLVAADTPSHRGAWTPGSRAWELFVRRQGERPSIPLIPEEDTDEADAMPNGSRGEESDDDFEYLNGLDGPTIASSLPIPMSSMNSRGPHILSLASYQPEPSIREPPDTQRLQKSGIGRGSSDAFRRAAYAERDLNRSIDPGALDFDADEVDDEDEADTEDQALAEAGQRGRDRALKILQACSELPEEGMWRSLAS